MDELTERSTSTVVKAARELAQLQAQAEVARAVLIGLQQAVRDAESHLASSQAAQLLEANEQLALAALCAQSYAETAAQALKEVSRSAELDALTNLPNRVLLLDRLTHAIGNAKRHRARLALLFLDLNNFKQVNDTLGHAVGDHVLQVTARRLVASVRAVDTVSRHGGDEFLILLDEVSLASDAISIANKVIAAVSAPTRVGDHVLRIKVSIGISVYPDHGEDSDMLIDRADAAMYHAKRNGLGKCVFHGDQPRGGRSLEHTPAHQSLEPPLTRYELVQALSAHERQPAHLRESNEQLVRVALSPQELRAAAAHAQRRQTELMSVLAHELRNPITIRNVAGSLGGVRADKPLLRRVQTIIEEHVGQMLLFVRDPRGVSRAHTGQPDLQRQVVEMAEIVNEVVTAYRPVMEVHLQHFGVHVPSSALEVHGDSLGLAQILSNLLDNASRYTPVGGEIELSVAIVGDTIVVTVSDSGIGITAEALAKVFDPFVQETHAIVCNGVGLGIGLTAVRELVKAHAGHIVASSAGTGLGSQFIATFPRARALTSRQG